MTIKRLAALILAAVSSVCLFCCRTPEPEKEYVTVTFDSGGGTPVAALRIEKGSAAAKPDDPVREGYRFECWMFMGTEWQFSDPVTRDITLTARWLDVTAEYRVTVGVSAAQKSRGRAYIEGSGFVTGMFRAGQTLTAVAVANEGYAFSVWIDNATGETLSENIRYTFEVRGERVIAARFVHAESGLENALNRQFYEALQNTSSERGSFYVTRKTGEDTRRLTFSFDRAAGKAEIAGEHIYKVSREGGEYSFTDENGAQADPPEWIYAAAEYLLDPPEISDESREQALLSIYSLFRDNLTDGGDYLGFTAPLGDLLEAMREEVSQNGERAVLAYLYKKLLSGGVQIPDFVGLTLADILRQTEGGEDIDQSVQSAIFSLYSRFEEAGLNADPEQAVNKYRAAKSEKISSLFSRIENSKPGGGLADIPEGCDPALAFAYAIAENFSLHDAAVCAVILAGADGTDLDFTDPSADFSSKAMTGKVYTSGGITRLEATLTGEGEGKRVEYNFVFLSEPEFS